MTAVAFGKRVHVAKVQDLRRAFPMRYRHWDIVDIATSLGKESVADKYKVKVQFPSAVFDCMNCCTVVIVID